MRNVFTDFLQYSDLETESRIEKLSKQNSLSGFRNLNVRIIREFTKVNLGAVIQNLIPTYIPHSSYLENLMLHIINYYYIIVK
jgi:hypothetical protein